MSTITIYIFLHLAGVDHVYNCLITPDVFKCETVTKEISTTFKGNKVLLESNYRAEKIKRGIE